MKSFLLRIGSASIAAAWALAISSASAAIGDITVIATSPVPGALMLAHGGVVAPVWASENDWPGVLRAGRDLQADVERVTGVQPAFATGVPSPVRDAVIVGTVGRSALIDELCRSGKLNVDTVRGKWEAYVYEVVENPLPGVARALVIAGSDKRGTIYGIYEISQMIGVSPWYWWSDIPPEHRDNLFLKPGRVVRISPSVRYRGIFLNDEAPDLTNWVRAKFGEVKSSANPHAPGGVANYGREFYSRLFEVLLRLRANYLWPAMWNNAFNEDDPENARLADEYGIVMGTSHQEPMLRAQKEWDWRYQKTLGSWNYTKDPEVLKNFWREGVRRNRNYESLITLGLRGANDTPMAPGGPDANRALLEKIVDVQRGILREEVNPDLAKVPQVWCLYKEVQEFYDAGMRVPDDVTLLWAEDNWGNLRRLPTAAERGRSGGAGVYYHFDYHGRPRSYQWLNTNPLPKIWEQMSMAKGYGADRVWIVNVGHFKGYELPLEYFLGLGWDSNRWGPDDCGEFARLWAEREFGSTYATEIADIVARYSKYNARRKPELLAPFTYSLTDYREAETVVADFHAITAKAEEIFALLPENRRDAFYQLVLFPAKASALVNELYVAAGRNALYAQQERASAGAQAVEVRRLFGQFLDLIGHFNGDFAAGKWAHFMDQPVLGYTTWRDPPKNNLDHLKLVEPAVPAVAALGVAVEGTAASNGPLRLPSFDAFNRQSRFIDVFNRGQGSLTFAVTTLEPWIQLSATNGTLGEDQRLWIKLDWSKVPAGQTTGMVKISSAATDIFVTVEVSNPRAVSREHLEGFVEANGYVSIEPEHYTRAIESGGNRWFKVSDYGRTLSGMKAWGPIDSPSTMTDQNSACLEYRMFLFTPGQAEVTAITAPTLNFIPDRGVRYAVSFDDEAPQVVTLVPAGWKPAKVGQREWEKSVSDNAHVGRSRHPISAAGYHTLKIWMIDSAVVLQKLVVNLGGLKPSYLGPPESYRGPASVRPAADQPVMRTDSNSHLAHIQLLEKAKAGGISVYFLGDSITRRWGATDYPDFLANWKQNFQGWNVADFGWGADTTQNILWRLQNGELDGVNPKIIVLLAGTNNIGKEAGDDAKVADVTRGITRLVDLCRAKAPDATMILMGIFPRNDGPVVPTINRINANLAKLADGKKVRYLNINDRLADAEGRLFEGMTMDQLHPRLKGYQIWADALKPIFTEILGPPSATDTAPPPTGDPSAKR